MATDTWMDKQNVTYTYSGILFNHKNEGNLVTYYRMDAAWGHFAKGNKPVTKSTVWSHFYEVSNFIQTESRMAVIRAGGRRKKSCWMDIKVQICKMKKLLRSVSQTMLIYLTLLNYTFKNGWDDTFYVVSFVCAMCSVASVVSDSLWSHGL